MAATYVTAAELRSALGIGSLYENSTLEDVCQASEDLIKKQLWFNEYPIVGHGIYQNVATVVMSASPTFVTGQEIVITKSGTPYNGTHTVTGTYPWSTGSSTMPWYPWWPFNRTQFPYGYSIIQFALTHADENYHLLVPYGKAALSSGVPDYASEPLINQAALMVAIDIWQARQQSNAGGISPDGTFGSSPYRMGSSILTRVRGLISPFLSPRGMVG